MNPEFYEPLKLNQTNRYAGYQFHARIRVDGLSDIDVFHYVILTIYQWVRSKVPEEDLKSIELQLPVAEEYASVSSGMFVPFHLNIGFALDITPVMDSGIWALRIKETDGGTPIREALVGRFFTTRVGVRLTDRGYTELGIRIDVTDPAFTEQEVPYAFRPGFVRSLAIQPAVVFEQIRELRYGNPERIAMDSDYKRFLYMLDSEENQLPLVVFTHARPEEKKPAAGMSMEELVSSIQAKSFLQVSGVQMPGTGREFPGAISPAKTAVASISAAEPPVVPYDADKFSRSAFAYGLTYVLGDKYTEKLRSRLKTEFRPGDILLCGVKKFRGGVRVFSCPGRKEEDRKKTYEAALLAVQSYSKHKTPYSYGSVVFEAEARSMEQQARIIELVNSGTLAEKDKVARLKSEMESLFQVIREKNEDIRRLNDQVSEAFDRGVAFRDSENAALKEEIGELRNEIAARQASIDQMQGSYKQAREISSVLEQMRSIATLPETNEEVVRYFRVVYRDRIDFTERGEASASKCGIRPVTLWNILYTISNRMVDTFRNGLGVTEEDITKATGMDVSFREGSMTREQKDYMRQREDQYNGKTISVEPHLKLKTSKGEPAYQRLHFWYDPDMQRIVIGYLGDHLDSAATRHVK